MQRVERALAADQPVLDDRDLQTRLGQPPARDLAGRAGADHHHVESPHGLAPYWPLVPRSATSPSATPFDAAAVTRKPLSGDR